MRKNSTVEAVEAELEKQKQLLKLSQQGKVKPKYCYPKSIQPLRSSFHVGRLW